MPVVTPNSAPGGSYDNMQVVTKVSVEGQTFSDITIKEVILGESLLTPGLQTAVTIQSFVYSDQPKQWGSYKNKPLTIAMNQAATSYSMQVVQQLYRIDNREMDINVGQTETLTLHACDQSLLNDAKSLISKSWKCTMPSEVVGYALSSCAGVRNAIVDNAGPARDYIAENIHPFQVVAQQANVALYNGDDPSFLHYMTYENLGTHYFRALARLESGPTVASFVSAEGGTSDLTRGVAAISFSFPCDFDYLSDLLNGLEGGNTLSTINPMTQEGSLFGGSTGGCGIGKGNHKTSMTNSGTSGQQNSCDMGVEQYLLLRQARMGLLEKDKIAFRITVPWDPNLHVGQIIGFTWLNKPNRNGSNSASPLYGSGDYLIVALKHNIQFGGYATTTLDCITGTIG